jgi:hypothetical protein
MSCSHNSKELDYVTHFIKEIAVPCEFWPFQGHRTTKKENQNMSLDFLPVGHVFFSLILQQK